MKTPGEMIEEFKAFAAAEVLRLEPARDPQYPSGTIRGMKSYLESIDTTLNSLLDSLEDKAADILDTMRNLYQDKQANVKEVVNNIILNAKDDFIAIYKPG